MLTLSYKFLDELFMSLQKLNTAIPEFSSTGQNFYEVPSQPIIPADKIRTHFNPNTNVLINYLSINKECCNAYFYHR